MTKIYLGSFALLSVGLIAGILLTGTPSSTTEIPNSADSTTLPSSSSEFQGDADARSRIEALEAELASVSARLKLLESRESISSDNADDEAPASSAESINVFGAPTEPVAVVDGLVAAGLDSFTAEQIARRVSESQLAQLELRDKAIREGYIGSEQYREERAAVRDQQVRVRDEVDESTYDRYLYFSGQSNRVAVSSVMLGSAAEQSGVEAGDVLIRYEDDALYKPGDIRGLTTQGEKDELVDLTLLRNGNQMTVSVPRGPLGVRLSAIRINPDDN